MKKAVIILLSTFMLSCHSQEKDKLKNKTSKNTVKPINLEIPINPKTMETYTTEEFSQKDLEHYKKCKADGEGYCEYENAYGDKIIETDDDMTVFYRDIIHKGSLFKINQHFYSNKKLHYKFETFVYNDNFIKGIKYEYDEQGKLIKAEDFDKPFKFNWEQVKKYCENELQLDLFKDKVGISNNEDSDYGTPVWEINYEGSYNKVSGEYIITLDGLDGKILLIKKVLGAVVSSPDGTGKGLKYQIIYDINNEKKKTSTIYKTYEGKDYTQAEWKIFEQEQYNEYLRKTGRADLVKPTDASKHEIRKNSLLADEDDVKPVKKRGFWG